MKLFSRKAEKDAIKEKIVPLLEDGRKRKKVTKIEFTPLSDCNILPFFKGF